MTSPTAATPRVGNAVQNYTEAIAWAAQTALRDTIGKTHLSDILSGREKLDAELQRTIDERTSP